MERKVVLGTMLALLLAGILLASVLPSVSSVQQTDSSRYFSAYSSQSTLVSGLITTNTTWTLTDSPFIVVGDVIVESDVFLTIEAGVFVKFTTGTNLIVDGGLVAQGNSTHTITFTSNATTPTPNDWGSIKIRGYSAATNCLNHVQIEYASTALTLAADCKITASTLKHNNKGILLEDAGNVYIGYVQIANNTGTGISGSIAQNITIENSEILTNGAGITNIDTSYLANLYLKNSTVARNDGHAVSWSEGRAEIDNCTVSANSGDGIRGPWAGGYVELYNSIVSNNTGTGLIARTQSYAQNCAFINNTNGLEMGGCYVVNCTISGNRNYGIRTSRNDFAVQPNCVDGCSISSNDVGIYVDYKSWIRVYGSNISNNRNGIILPTDFCSATVLDSTIQSNTECGVRFLGPGGLTLSGSVVKHNLYGVYGAVGLYGIYGHVYASKGSMILNNTIGVLASNFEASSTTIADNSLVNVQIWREGWGGETATLEHCNVYSSLVGIRLQSGTINYCNIYNHTEYDVENMAGNEINATHNWWGTTNEMLIEQGIYDFYDDYTLGKVLYKPYLTAPTHHNVAITNVTASPATVTLGDAVSIEVTVVNEGDFAETFNVTVYYDANAIGTQTVTALNPRAEMPLLFVWDTSGVAEGVYTISAEASVVEDEEDTDDNRFDDGTVTVLAPPVASFNYTPIEPLVDGAVTFNASESYDPDGFITSWNWNFGDGNITTIPDPTTTHAYASYGVFVVNLTVIDNDGLVDSEIKSITVRQYPTARFIYYPSIPEMGGNVLFDASASTPNGGTILSYTWDFGDGNVTGTSSPKILHVYFDYGNFTVTLSIQDDEGLTDVETKIIHVHALPVVDFTYTPVSPVVDSIVTFNASESFDFDGYIVVYVWDLGDGTNATETDPIVHHSYSQAGIYTVALSVIDNDGLTSTTMKDLNVGKIPASVSISTSSPSVYLGFSVNITGTLHDLYGNGLIDETVVLYYAVSGVGTWTPITSDSTDNLGNYQTIWIPPATGYFVIKAEWTGNATHFGANNTATLCSLAYQDQYVFSVESNSTISELAFDTRNWKLSFTAAGPDGTTGYVKVTVAKSLVADITNIRVFLDGRALEFSITSTDDSWLLTFTYEHSVHQVEVDIDITKTEDTTPPAISVLSPENMTYSVNDILLGFTVSEFTPWIGYSVDGEVNVTIYGDTTLSDLSEGLHTVTVYANDTARNMGSSETIHFTTDTVLPSIEILSPENATYTESSVSLTCVSDEETAWVGYCLDGQDNVTISGDITISGLSDGSHTLIVYAKDVAGNTAASEAIHFCVETPPPAEPLPSWIIPAIVIIGGAAAGSLVYFAKIRKGSQQGQPARAE